MQEERKHDVKVIFGLTLIHFIGDFYASFVTPLIPVFVDKFALTLTQVGLITGVSRFFAFIVQPSVGYIADHYRTRMFVLGGPLLSIVCIPLVGLVPGFFMLILCVSIGSIGNSMFHPTCAGMVSAYAGRHFGLSISIFGLGGTLAFGAGPLFITYFVDAYGLEATPWTMIIGLVLMVILFRIVPMPEGERLGNYGFIGSIKEALGPAWKPILLIWTVMVLRSYVGQSFFTYLPVLYAREGHSLVFIGKMVALFTVAGAISGLLAGHLADRVGYKPIFYISHGLTFPCLYMVLFSSGHWVYPAFFLGGFFIMATLPLGVALAQELAPKGRSMVSSLMMGLAFGTGGMMAPLTGKLADLYSIRTVLACLAIIPFLTVFLIRFLPKRSRGYQHLKDSYPH